MIEWGNGSSLAITLEKIALTRKDLISNVIYEFVKPYYPGDVAKTYITVEFPKYIIDDTKTKLYHYIKDRFSPTRITFYDGNLVIVYEK